MSSITYGEFFEHLDEIFVHTRTVPDPQIKSTSAYHGHLVHCLLVVIAACGAVETQEPDYFTGTPHWNSPGITTSNSEILQSTKTPETDSSQKEGECLRGEEQWCVAYHQYGLPPECANSSNLCTGLVCNQLPRYANHHPRSMDCLRSMCPSSYSQTYVNCAKDMDYEQASCLRGLLLKTECTQPDVQSCVFTDSERRDFMLRCLN